LYSLSEVAKLFRVTPIHIYRLIYEEKLQAYKGSNGMVRISEDHVREFKRNYSTRRVRWIEKMIREMEGRVGGDG
jgi:excisionase family DNA binding protein